MIIDLIEWLYDHWQEVTFNTLLLFILRKFILSELQRLFRFNRNDAILYNLKIIMEDKGLGDQWKSSLPMNGFKITLPQLSKRLYLYSVMGTSHLKIRRKKKMKQLLSKKFILAIVGALIPVINAQFGLHLTFDDLIGVWSFLGVCIAAIAHVDAKSATAALNNVKVAVTADPNTTYKDMIKTVNIVHNAITSVLADLKKDDGSQAFRDAADAYTQLHSIVNDFRKPEPLPFIPSLPEKVIS